MQDDVGVIYFLRTFFLQYLILHLQIQAEERLNNLQEHLTTLIHLHEQFTSYRNAFNKLLLEIARRRQYREAAENIVKGMMKQLDAMTEGQHEWHLPICLTYIFWLRRGKSCPSTFQRGVRLSFTRRHLSLHRKRSDKMGGLTMARQLSRGITFHSKGLGRRCASNLYFFL